MGRDHELRVLGEAIARPPAIIVVEGEAGVGKTRLIGEALARLPASANVLLGRSPEIREPFPFGPLVEALRKADLPARHSMGPVAGSLRRLLPELGDHLPPEPDMPDEPRIRRHLLYRGFREVLAALGPSIVVLEDLHLADDQTQEALRLIASDSPPDLVLILSYRAEELAAHSILTGLVSTVPPGTEGLHLHLDPLDLPSIGGLVRGILDVSEFSEEFTAYLFDRTSGLPLAVEETLGLLQDQKSLIWRRGEWVRRALTELEVPPAFREAILARVQRLRPTARQVVDAAAVMAAPVDEDVLARASGVPHGRFASALSAALDTGILRMTNSGQVRFRHDLSRQAAYDAIPAPKRRELHARAARALVGSRPPPVGLVAYHAKEAKLVDLWLEYGERAAKLATSLNDDSGAVLYLKDLVAMESIPGRVRGPLAVDLARAGLDGLVGNVVIPVIREVLKADGLTPGTRGELRMRLGFLVNEEGDSSGAIEHLRASLRDLRNRPGLAAEAMAALALVAADAPPEERLAWADRALATSARVSDPVSRIAAAVDAGYTKLLLGDGSAWQLVNDLPRPGGSVREDHELLRGYRNLAQVAFWVGHQSRAEGFLEAADQIAAGRPYWRLADSLASERLVVEWGAGRWDGLRDRALSLCETNRPILREESLEAQLVLGWLLLASGELAEADSRLTSVRDGAHGVGIPFILASACAGLARIHLGKSDPEWACREAEFGVQALGAQGGWTLGGDVVPEYVEAKILCGATDDARSLLLRFGRGLRGLDAPAARAALSQAKGVLAEAGGMPADAARGYARAARAWRALAHPYREASALERLGRCLAARGGDSGVEELRRALDIYDRLGATWDAGRAARYLRTRGVRLVHKGSRRSAGLDLSSREREVALLVAQGLTNKQIGIQLFLSARTVAHHVASGMRKLGVPSRTALGVAVSRSGPHADGDE